MIGEVLLDTENLFHGFRARPRPDGVAPTLQQALFPATGPARGDVRVVLRLFDRVLAWYAAVADAVIRRVDSFGKPSDPGVRTLLLALGADDETFARARRDQEGDLAPDVDGDLELALFHRAGIPVVHHSVHWGRDLAERALVAAFDERRAAPDAPDSFLIGGEDHDALFPVDHAVGSDPSLQVWVVLPPASRVWRRMHRVGSYRHLSAERVRALSDLPMGGDPAQVGGDRRPFRAHVRATIAKARRSARFGIGFGPARTVSAQAVEERLAALVGVHEGGLDRRRLGSPEWVAGVGDPWLVDAATRWIPACASRSEQVRLEAAGLAGPRAAALVRWCGIAQIRHDRPDIALSTLLAFVRELADVHPYYLDVVSAIGAEAARAEATSSVHSAAVRTPDADPLP